MDKETHGIGRRVERSGIANHIQMQSQGKGFKQQELECLVPLAKDKNGARKLTR